MARLNMLHFLVAKKVAGKAHGANRAALISALSKEPITAFFAGKSAKLEHELGRGLPAGTTDSTTVASTRREANGASGFVVVNDSEVTALGIAYSAFKRADDSTRVAATEKLVQAVEVILNLREP